MGNGGSPRGKVSNRPVIWAGALQACGCPQNGYALHWLSQMSGLGGQHVLALSRILIGANGQKRGFQRQR